MDEQSLEPAREIAVGFYGEIPAALVVIDEDGTTWFMFPCDRS